MHLKINCYAGFRLFFGPLTQFTLILIIEFFESDYSPGQNYWHLSIASTECRIASEINANDPIVYTENFK